MIDLTKSSFFLPTKQFRELSILLAMRCDSELSQHGIASKVHLSSAMVNGYVRAMKKRRLVDVIQRNKRDNAYQLTSSGNEILMHHLSACSTEVARLFFPG